jgi:hypothetical protein
MDVSGMDICPAAIHVSETERNRGRCGNDVGRGFIPTLEFMLFMDVLT